MRIGELGQSTGVDIETIRYYVRPLRLEQLYTVAANYERKQAEANNGDDDAGQQGWPEADARE